MFVCQMLKKAHTYPEQAHPLNNLPVLLNASLPSTKIIFQQQQKKAVRSVSLRTEHKFERGRKRRKCVSESM